MMSRRGRGAVLMSCTAVVGRVGGADTDRLLSGTIGIFWVESGVARKYRKHTVVGRQGSMAGQYHLCESLPNHCVKDYGGGS